jgi:integrase
MRKRRGRGEGSVFQRSDGVWTSTITIGYDESGKRKRRTIYGNSKAAVLEKLTQLKHAASTGTLADPTRLTIREFLERWLEDVQRPNIRASTHARYVSLMATHITPHVGGVRLAKVQPLTIQGLYAKLTATGASGRTRELVHVVLRKAFKQAVLWGQLSRNPCDAVARPKPTKRTIRYFTAEETSQLLSAARGERLQALYVLAVSTGIRQGELFGLKWRDVDWNASAVAVQRTVDDLRGTLIVGEPKTTRGRRRVELPAFAMQALREHRKAMFAEGHASDWIFCDTKGGLLRRGNVLRRSYFPLLKTAKLAPLNFHCLRHTAATLLLLQGTHPKVVQERLGHATISITLDTYSHVLPSMQRDAADKLDALLGA